MHRRVERIEDMAKALSRFFGTIRRAPAPESQGSDTTIVVKPPVERKSKSFDWPPMVSLSVLFGICVGSSRSLEM